MSDIESWLAGIGLEKYADLFKDAEIDVAILPELREDDLKELGLPIGPRRKIWGAIQHIKEPHTDRPTSEFDQGGAELHGADPQKTVHAERRHLTVMFVDLVGSTEMVMRMDAEDMRGIITQYQKAVASVVAEFRGFVATLLGDGMLCYFGWPQANEGDAVRAVRAGLSIIEATRKIMTPDGDALASRVGVASGVVVVGDLIGGGARQEAAVVGETPNLAARLQAVAQPNQLVVPGEVLPLLGTNFDLSPLGPQTLKGIARRVEAFVVEGETAAESRFAARRTGALTPIVGRDRELDLIMDRWADTKSSHGQMVLVSGEAGIGKSRIVRAVVDDVGKDGPIRFTYQCSPSHTDSAFYPFIQQLSYSAGLQAEDTTEERLDKIEAIVGGVPETRALVARLLDIDGTARYGPLDVAPADQRARLMNVMVNLITTKANERPVLVVFEDLHWIDPTSLELLTLLLEALPNRNIMVLATTRPGFDHEFNVEQAVTSVVLNRLSRETTYAIVNTLTDGKPLPEDIGRIIARRTDGVPLFIEELTKTILESGSLIDDAGRFVVDGSLDDVAIPATLQDSLMERLDRLNLTKEIAQIAACIGREFSFRLMAKICELSQPDLEAALKQLMSAELVHQRGSGPNARYLFKHALVRDAAYESLLKERRKLYHERILTALETDPDARPELLATHAEAARLTDRAIGLWEVAGKAAIARPAYREAEAHLRRAIALNAPKLAAGDKDALLKALGLHVQLFVALSPGAGLWADKTVATLEDALALADQVGETPLRGDIIYGLLLSNYFRGNLDNSIARADELNVIADASRDLAQLLVGKRLAAIGRLKMGRFAEAQPYLDEAEELCKVIADQDLAARFGHDPVVAVKIYQSLSASFDGRIGDAERYRIEAEDRARKIAHTNTSCAMYGIAVTCAHVANDIAAERRNLKILQELIEEHDVTASRLWAKATSALLQIADGDVSGIDAYRKAEATMVEANIRLLVPGNRVVAAHRAFDHGCLDDAIELTDAAETMMNETGEKSWLPDVYRLRATFALADNDAAAAEHRLKQAIDLSQKQGGALWEFRASLDLAKLYQKLGRFDEAKLLIEPILKKTPEGDCPQEVLVARTLMQNAHLDVGRMQRKTNIA